MYFVVYSGESFTTHLYCTTNRVQTGTNRVRAQKSREGLLRGDWRALQLNLPKQLRQAANT
jgi:hypothetical protein